MVATDEELVARSRSGDAESFNQLVLRWERPIYALAYRVIGRDEDARDVVQETFLRAFRALPGFKGQAKFSSWLYRIALNLCRDWIRRRKRTPLVEAPEGVDIIELAAEQGPVESIEELVARREMSRVVAEGMQQLPEEQRTAIVLKEYHGLTFQEIAELQGCPAQHREDAFVSRTQRAASPPRTAGNDEHIRKGIMSDRFSCHDKNSLIAYLYDEVEPPLRRRDRRTPSIVSRVHRRARLALGGSRRSVGVGAAGTRAGYHDRARRGRRPAFALVVGPAGVGAGRRGSAGPRGRAGRRERAGAIRRGWVGRHHRVDGSAPARLPAPPIRRATNAGGRRSRRWNRSSAERFRSIGPRRLCRSSVTPRSRGRCHPQSRYRRCSRRASSDSARSWRSGSRS